MLSIELVLPRPHAAQWEIIQSATRFNAIACGRRFGKSTLLIDRLIEKALGGYPVGWFSPTYKMLADVWREFVRVLQPVTKRQNAQEHRLELITGGIVDMWSLDAPDVARGRKYARVAIDEAAMVRDLGEAWQAVIRPTLADYQGDLWAASTPKGRNFFAQMFGWGQDPLNEEWASWQMPTSANPFIPESEIDAMRHELPQRTFEQEVLALFLEDAGGVFRGVRARATAQRVEPYTGEFVAGIDWAQQHDFTVITVLDANTKHMVDFDRFNKVDWHLQRERLITMHKRWNCRQIIAERNSIGSPNIEALQREGLPVVAFDTTATSKPPLIESLVLAFERGEIEIFNDPVLVGELEAYERIVSAHTGRSSYSAPAGLHDDAVVSLALAWHGVTMPTLNIRWI
jgi:hypothetical protein